MPRNSVRDYRKYKNIGKSFYQANENLLARLMKKYAISRMIVAIYDIFVLKLGLPFMGIKNNSRSKL